MKTTKEAGPVVEQYPVEAVPSLENATFEAANSTSSDMVSEQGERGGIEV